MSQVDTAALSDPKRVIPIVAMPRPRPLLQSLGDAMQQHAGGIRLVQWIVVLFYLVLVGYPAFQPLPPQHVHLWENLTLAAQFVFWGVWWPFVILSMMLVGRVWCGLFCPEGMLTELASKHGLGRATPKWMKWGGWSFVAFVLTTVYGQLVSVYEYPQPALLILGGSTIVAVAVGFVYGRNKRVWCKYLCPVSGVFALLARLSPVHFRVDREAWDSWDRPHQPGQPHVQPINCAPLVDMRRMTGAADCHMCGRCSGHRDAVALSARPFGREIVRLKKDDVRPWEVRLLVWGIIGVAGGAFQWSASPWFVAAKLKAAEWLVDHDAYMLLQDNAPWWLLTHYPQANDVFTWLDGLGILLYIGITALLLGSWITLWLRAAGTMLPGDSRQNALRLAYSLVPMGGFGVFLGLSAMTVTLLKPEGAVFDWLPAARGTALTLAVLWSAWLALRMIASEKGTAWWRNAGATACVVAAIAGAASAWWLLFFGW